jgi:hypothetical protein
MIAALGARVAQADEYFKWQGHGVSLNHSGGKVKTGATFCAREFARHAID